MNFANFASGRQTKIHNIGATLVGVDKFGNKYYEKLGDTQCGRHRWVEYAKKDRYDASQVPPEWHGWLHCITDHTGDEASPLLMLKPKRYGVEHKENLSGKGNEFIYHSKGHALNPGQRDWTRYQPWQPTKADMFNNFNVNLRCFSLVFYLGTKGDADLAYADTGHYL
ncbi:NADH dehydrogenase [ubiquinone] 1 alpha subcomplex subunit 12 - like 2 [Theobroma cacao]|nr:NADH dehydrogenase [ubiquinone] 1 alpha subcomplex subunit 12 - like 2 [Theobroma cacao]